MTPEEIKKIAEEVAHIRAFDGGYFPHEKEIREDYEILLQWLTARFYLVEKGKVEQEYKNCIYWSENHPDQSECKIAKSVANELKSLFGPDIRKGEEE